MCFLLGLDSLGCELTFNLGTQVGSLLQLVFPQDICISGLDCQSKILMLLCEGMNCSFACLSVAEGYMCIVIQSLDPYIAQK